MYANRKGNQYKKVYQQYRINDYVWYETKKHAEIPGRFGMVTDQWEKWYFRK